MVGGVNCNCTLAVLHVKAGTLLKPTQNKGRGSSPGTLPHSYVTVIYVCTCM